MIKQPSVYRNPPDPGFVGGYNWSAMFVGLLLLVLVNIGATQFVAYRLEYQPALGSPLLRYQLHSIYQPFAWAPWLLRYGSSADPRIRLPLLSGALIVVAGAAIAVILVYGMNLRRAKRLSANTEDLHGSARWATQTDIEATGLLDAQQGVYVGGWCTGRSNRLHYLRHNGPEHVLAFAPTRSGKGVGLVIPTLLAWSESAVVYDIKGENWAKTAGFRAKCGHLCFKFSPVELANGSRFNPLAEVRIGTPRDVSDAQNVADMIVRTGEDSPQERYWQDAAASITAGMILHVCYASAASGRVACLADLSAVFTRPGQTFRETLAELESFPHDPEREHRWHTADGDQTVTHPVVREKVREMLDKEDKDFSGVLSTAKTALTLYSDPLVARNTSASDFTINDLVNHEHPASLYLVVPPSDKIRLRPLIRLIFTMIVNRLTERMDFEGAEQKRNRYRLLFMVDEFPSLKRMEVFADALSYMAGYGLKAYLITQDKGSNVGVATGAMSGVFVLDVDPKNGGQESIDALVMKHGRIETLQAITGSRASTSISSIQANRSRTVSRCFPDWISAATAGWLLRHRQFMFRASGTNGTGSKSSRTCPFSRHRAGCWSWCTASEQMGTRPVLNCRRRSRRANATRHCTGMPARCAAPAAGSS